MDLALLVYGVSLLDKVHTLLMVAFFICGGIAAVFYIYRFSECGSKSYYSQAENAAREKSGLWAIKYATRFAVASITSIIVAITIPTEKTAYMMLGAYAAQKVAENEQVAAVSGKIMKIVNVKLDQYVEDAIDKATEQAQEPTRKKGRN